MLETLKKTQPFNEYLYSRLISNPKLKEIYNLLVLNRAISLFNLDIKDFESLGIFQKTVDIEQAITLIDILSKSYGTDYSDLHKTIALEMSYMLYEQFPDNLEVLHSYSDLLMHLRYIEKLGDAYLPDSFLDQLTYCLDKNELQIPTGEQKWFLPSQKKIFMNFNEEAFSYSAPTSMGKSFLMRVFIKNKIMNENEAANFGIVVPTKALINETKAELIGDFKNLLSQRDYKVITSINDYALDGRHNFIFVVTPERLLYLLIRENGIKLDYLFIDEAYKMSASDSRSLIYFKVLEKIDSLRLGTKVFLASPFIPNPEKYLEAVGSYQADIEYPSMNISYAPVSQIKYFVNAQTGDVRFYNSYEDKFIDLFSFRRELDVNEFISKTGSGKQSVIYCRSRKGAIDRANEFIKYVPKIEDKELVDFSKEIKADIHKDYYLAECIEHGIAYHIGYLPQQIRFKIEELYRNGKIKYLFCTSTLLEGVNFPIENLYITSYYKGPVPFTDVDFKNLMGRCGRIKYNLLGNVFYVFAPHHNESLQKAEGYLERKIEPQKLSIEKLLTKDIKKDIIDALEDGSTIVPRKDTEEDEAYDYKRKAMLLLQNDIVNEHKTRIKAEFGLSPEQEIQIKEEFSKPEKTPIDDINVSRDQITSLKEAIRNGLCYPDIDEEETTNFYPIVLKFLEELAPVFNWDLYERETLGYRDKNNQHSKLRWYAVLLSNWLTGHGIGSIIQSSIRYNAKKDQYGRPKLIQVYPNKREPYNGSRAHNNIIISETLQALDNIILYKLSNYFLKFSEEYQNIRGDLQGNDWHEFIEFGTTNTAKIYLEKNGFTREAATKIYNSSKNYLVFKNGKYFLKDSIFQESNDLIKREVDEIRYDSPDLFIS